MFVTIKDGLITIKIYVQPGAKKSECQGTYAGAIKIRLSAPPVDGKANEELIQFIATELAIAKKKVLLMHGEKSRNKTIGIDASHMQDHGQALVEQIQSWIR
jgi:uncharacterized protein